MDVVVEGRALLGEGLTQCCIGIKDGQIREVKKILTGDEHYDFGNRIILPAAIDPHVHFRDPGETHKEDFESGSLAAVFGGVSCVMDMPNTQPPTTSLSRLKDKRRTASKKSWADFGLFGGCTPGVDIAGMASEAVGFKLYLGSTTGDLVVDDDREIERMVSDVVSAGKVLSVHAEDDAYIQRTEEKDIIDHLENRPFKSETSAISKMARMSEYKKINICHLSSSKGMEMLSRLPFSCEITPHHMLLDVSKDIGATKKVNPPLRYRKDRDALFYAFSTGSIDMLASDHAPHTRSEKEKKFDDTPSGIPGVETMVPLMLPLVKRGIIGLNTLVRTMAHNPARIFGLNKGMIQVGKDADLIVVDLRDITEVRGEDLHSRCRWTPFEGWNAVFPQSVFIRGKQVVSDGAVMGDPSGRDVVEAD